METQINETLSRDFRDLCLSLKASTTMSELEMNLRYAFMISDQLGERTDRVTYDYGDVTLDGTRYPDKLTEAFWMGVANMMTHCDLKLVGARLTALRSPDGRVTGVTVDNAAAGSERCSGRRLSYSLEDYIDSVESREEAKAFFRKQRYDGCM